MPQPRSPWPLASCTPVDCLAPLLSLGLVASLQLSASMWSHVQGGGSTAGPWAGPGLLISPALLLIWADPSLGRPQLAPWATTCHPILPAAPVHLGPWGLAPHHAVWSSTSLRGRDQLSCSPGSSGEEASQRHWSSQRVGAPQGLAHGGPGCSQQLNLLSLPVLCCAGLWAGCRGEGHSRRNERRGPGCPPNWAWPHAAGSLHT